ncbi:restriction endonuclease [Ramlibacter sp. H39-3-26]|uniref:restriction endonuclease n=1 Tax=Curvibacter soli TaxID=3031331 RepID=UPI0023DACF49|nr:restriction endonuclease [Ramlibacter sp. H39-3-26]MDF1485365.1 restriction endonuclease [Ramlibacter sp. H39-3-26]
MARRSKGGLAEDVFSLAAVLPWWVGVVLAIVTYAVLHRFAVGEVAANVAPGQMGEMIVGQLVKALATWGQYLVPLLLLAGAVASAIGRRKRQGLAAEVAASADDAALRSMSWRDFELVAGEAFRLRGYTVIETGGGGADGGIDLQLTRGGETFLVQCKQWKAYKVSVNVVRELYGVMAAQGAAGGFVVTSGVFTADARSFVQGRNIELIDGPALKKMIDAVQASKKLGATSVPASEPSAVAEPACPRCGGAMVKRVAKQGANAGKAFWGCSSYPQCRGVRAIE